jgi:hypothetical protein
MEAHTSIFWTFKMLAFTGKNLGFTNLRAFTVTHAHIIDFL